MKIRRSNRRRRQAGGKLCELLLIPLADVDHRMTDFRAVEAGACRRVEALPEALQRMGCDGDAALPVDIVELRGDGPPPVHRPLDADRNDVVVDRVNLLTSEHRGTADRARERGAIWLSSTWL